MGGTGLFGEVVSLNGHVLGVDTSVRKRLLPTIQLCVSVCFLQICGTRMSSCGSFTYDLLKVIWHSDPTLLSPLGAGHSAYCLWIW
jgi:hypothetical protein